MCDTMKVGYDIDGVLAIEQEGVTEDDIKDATRSEIVIPDAFDEVYLISGRAKKLEEATKKWLEKNNITFDGLVLKDYDGKNEELTWDEIKEDHAEWKAEKIKELELDLYVEDRKYLVDRLQEICPHCKIIHIRGDDIG